MPLLEQRNYPHLIDKRIVDSHDFHQLFWMVELAGKCLEKDPNKRHTMERVVKTLSHVMEGNADYAIDFNPLESSSCADIGNNNHNSKQEDGRGNEEDKILGTGATFSSSSNRWSPSSSNSTHEEYGRRKIPLKHEGPSPNKGKLLYNEMIH
ncbi:hypothetical protein RND71_000993 [Anisodus tanguticus]|uniref:Uncharacterized protein n=1 Tax=Anisodus tanguticus TaxID=243964 RepID=A0AAE1T247_9SOLA|nr:hypothetical protein RND71_000993 [Anisodus tanguticus]